MIVSEVSPPLLLPWPPCQGSVSSSMTKAVLDLGSLGREVAGSGSWSRCLSMVLLQPLPRWAHKWALYSKQNHPPHPATQARGPMPHRGKGVVTGTRERDRSKQVLLPQFSSLFSTSQVLSLDFLPSTCTLSPQLLLVTYLQTLDSAQILQGTGNRSSHPALCHPGSRSSEKPDGK